MEVRASKHGVKLSRIVEDPRGMYREDLVSLARTLWNVTLGDFKQMAQVLNELSRAVENEVENG